MNKAFYEFWGHLFLNLARGQQQLDDLSALMQQGAAGMSDLAVLFRRIYGLGDNAPADTASVPWQNAVADFQRSLSQLAALWGWVPQAEHQRVVRDRDTLQKKIDEQAAVIGQLKALLNEEGRDHNVFIDHWKRSLKEQNEQFQALMESLRNSVDDKH